MDNRSPDLLKPTLLAGLLFGFLAGVPIIGFINCACCALIVGCGFFASYLYGSECRKRDAEFRPGTGALVGLVAGGFYALMATLVGTVANLAMGDVVARSLAEFMRNLPNMPPETLEMIDQMVEQAGTFSIVNMIFSFLLTLGLALVFSTAGGLIGGAVFKVERRLPPPAPPAPPPPYVPPPPPPAAPPHGFDGGPPGSPPPTAD